MFDDPIFRDEAKAREWFERELWPDGPACPHCGNVNEATLIGGEKHAHRAGLYMCNACRKQFSVTVGTLLERSHIPLHKWLYALFMLMSSKKGVSAHQVHRMTGVSYKSAWFMMMRLREALRITDPEMLGGEGKTVEVDETYIGGKEGNRHVGKRRGRRVAGGAAMEPAVALVERGGSVRSFHVGAVNSLILRSILTAQVDRTTSLMTDQNPAYRSIGKEFASHETVNHSIDEYVRGDAYTNTIENYFSILKRGINGVYHHVSQQHLKRYLAEFDYRYNERSALGVDDATRTAKAAQGIVGKRLTYQKPRNRRDSAPLA